MDEQIRFTCKRCGEEHSGVPSFGFGFPIQLMDVPEAEREERVFLTETPASSTISIFSFWYRVDWAVWCVAVFSAALLLFALVRPARLLVMGNSPDGT